MKEAQTMLTVLVLFVSVFVLAFEAGDFLRALFAAERVCPVVRLTNDQVKALPKPIDLGAAIWVRDGRRSRLCLTLVYEPQWDGK